MILEVSYSIWKQLVENHGWDVYHYLDGASSRKVWTGDREHIYVCYVYDDDYSDWNTNFASSSTSVTVPDDAIASIIGLEGVGPHPQQEDYVPLMALAPRIGEDGIISTVNFADKCTWFAGSTRVTDETLTVYSGDGSGKTYEAVNEWWIDMYTGRLLNEEKWKASVSHGYQVVVKDNGVEQSIRPFPSSSGTWDCEILYKEGRVRFLNSAPTGPVVVSYSYADSSDFYLEPEDGCVLKIEKGEADFSVGDSDGDYRVIYATEIGYFILGYAWYYSPQYSGVRAHASGNITLSGLQTVDGVVLEVGDRVACFNQSTSTQDGIWVAATGAWSRDSGMPVGSHVEGCLYFPEEGTTYGKTGQLVTNTAPNDVVGTDDITVTEYFSKNERIELKEERYKRANQIIQDARGAHVVIRAVGATDTQLQNLKNSTWDIHEFRRQSRGFASDIQPIPFPYDTCTPLESSKGHQLCVCALDDIAMEGELCTLTFYCTSKQCD